MTVLAYDTETTSLYPHHGGEMFAFSTCDESGSVDVNRLDGSQLRHFLGAILDDQTRHSFEKLVEQLPVGGDGLLEGEVDRLAVGAEDGDADAGRGDREVGGVEDLAGLASHLGLLRVVAGVVDRGVVTEEVKCNLVWECLDC